MNESQLQIQEYHLRGEAGKLEEAAEAALGGDRPLAAADYLTQAATVYDELAEAARSAGSDPVMESAWSAAHEHRMRAMALGGPEGDGDPRALLAQRIHAMAESCGDELGHAAVIDLSRGADRLTEVAREEARGRPHTAFSP